MIDFGSILSRVPNYDRYLSASELNEKSKQLAEEHPDKVSLLRLGKTKGGNEIIGLRIGKGKHNALVYGFPNPEEPLGGLVLDYFSRALATEEELEQLNYTWYLINCIDPDGAQLAECYLKGPYTPYNWALNYYRTPVRATGEDNFPYRYEDLDLTHNCAMP